MYDFQNKSIKEQPMTICIGALFDDAKGCYLISDQMMTLGFPFVYEYESGDPPKIIKINERCQILIAGSVLFANEIADIVKNDIKQSGDLFTNLPERIRLAYHQVKHKFIVQNEFEPRGISFDEYKINQTKMVPPLVQLLDNALKNTNLGVELIIAYKDDEDNWHISTVTNPGVLVSNDSIGYAVIGSGSIHAIYSLIDSEYCKKDNKTVVEEKCKKAKARAEVAPGVGHKTSDLLLGE